MSEHTDPVAATIEASIDTYWRKPPPDVVRKVADSLRVAGHITMTTRDRLPPDLAEARSWLAYGVSGGLIPDEGMRAAIRLLLDAVKPHCGTCGDLRRIRWMVEGDPNVYIEADADGMMPCPDCGSDRAGRTMGDVWRMHGHPDRPCVPPEAVDDWAKCRIAVVTLPPLSEETLRLLGVEPSATQRALMDKVLHNAGAYRRCVCDEHEPASNERYTPTEVWSRCRKCRGLLWTGVGAEPPFPGVDGYGPAWFEPSPPPLIVQTPVYDYEKPSRFRLGYNRAMGAARNLRERADSAKQAERRAREGGDTHAAAALGGKNVAYREAAEVIEALVKDRRLPTRFTRRKR